MIKKSNILDIKNDYWDIYLDQVHDETYFWDSEWKLSYNYNEWGILLNYNWEHLLWWGELTKQTVEKLDANYMIAPNVS